ncbi:IclR family transcriptional regulator [Puniceibacterium sp. IMCC21224]|uniref:IclR family transcriptional regulator n=1 Tax=Puniceibacterium sp. IMCC21224 TaxID=1618204 RepID=UPI00064DAE1E|nr:IclR family transcriptional regulator [Puniceibacterium sp. IMCC21224]KMK68486.1 transcriptional regulator, IclR family [Puniceibacterium sp. IMCC21224]
MQDAKSPDQKDQRRGIQSVEVGFELIRRLSAVHGKLPLKTLAERAGMAPSKAHLYLVSFQRLGLVVQDGATSHYGLGPTALQLGLAAINQLNVVDLGREMLPQALEETSTSISLSVWGNRGATIVFRLDSELPVPLSVRVGYVLPLMSTATGRTFMAHLKEREWIAIAQIEDAARPGLLAQTRKELDGIRELGVAATHNQIHSGFFGLSCPVFDSDNTICAAITALGLSNAADLGPDGGIATVMKRVSRAMSETLGATIK